MEEEVEEEEREKKKEEKERSSHRESQTTKALNERSDRILRRCQKDEFVYEQKGLGAREACTKKKKAKEKENGKEKGKEKEKEKEICRKRRVQVGLRCVVTEDGRDGGMGEGGIGWKKAKA
uniref:Uncharacterized protein n=1 Tax=Vespula pensylvanica TaxID=30213 RepID=A0A834PE46_VESPE|nr:hypothetical protein H0235_004030 [Vespula pensylvanica]